METAYDGWKTAYPAHWDYPEPPEPTDEEIEAQSLSDSCPVEDGCERCGLATTCICAD